MANIKMEITGEEVVKIQSGDPGDHGPKRWDCKQDQERPWVSDQGSKLC